MDLVINIRPKNFFIDSMKTLTNELFNWYTYQHVYWANEKVFWKNFNDVINIMNFSVLATR